MAGKETGVVAVVVPNEFRRMGQTMLIQPAEKARRQPAPEKEALKRRLYDAISTMRQLAAEASSGVDLAAALARLRARTFAENLANLVEGGHTDGGVSAADMDRLDEVLRWLDRYIKTDDRRRLLLDWARGADWETLTARYGMSKTTLWRRVDRAFDDILHGLRVDACNR